MATTVIIRHQDGRRIPIGVGLTAEHASHVKRELEQRIACAQTLTVASVTGSGEEITAPSTPDKSNE